MQVCDHAPATLTSNAIRIYKERYLEGNETIEQRWRAVADGDDAYYDLMASLKFLPNSPALFNAGRNNGCTMSACFVFSIHDSMFGPNSIVETRAKAIAVAKAGGGVGYDFSLLRPKNSLIKSVHRKACGPVAVLKDKHAISHLITQGGKRDLAQMGILACDHPDIVEWIHCKDNDPQGLGSFNLSVGWKDTWVKRALAGSVKEEALWQEQCESAWAHGCPGMWFPDINNRKNINPQIGPIVGTNPCVIGDTPILTRNGWYTIETLCGEKVEVWNGEEWSEVIPKVTGENQRVVKVTTSDGHSLTCTLGHKFILADGTRIYAKNLRAGDVLCKYETVICAQGHADPDNDPYLAGFYCGDGFDNDERNTQCITFYDKKVDIGVELQRRGLVRLQPYDHKQDRQRSTLNQRVPSKTTVPINNSLNYKLGWLAGLLDSDGCFVYSDKSRRSYSYQISSTEIEFLKDVSLMLRTMGVASKCSKSHSTNKTKWFGNVSYECKDCYVLCISSTQARKLAELGLQTLRLPTEGNEPQRDATRFVKVVSVEDAGTADKVYCFTEPIRHAGVFGGILTGNCGEVPNRNNEPCNLGSLNAWRYVNLRTRQFDYGMWEDDVRTATRFLDDILDRNCFPHPDITEMANLTRKLGLGIMGWADMLALMGVHYDTYEAIALVDKIWGMAEEVSLEESAKLGHEKGPYPGYSDTLTQGPFARNETRTSIAPTGTISILAGASSSLEPHYLLEWERTTKEGLKLQENIQVWDYLDGFTPKTAAEVSPAWHVRMQAAFQKYTDLGVSKTVNLPNSATVQDVSDAYKLMWELGCKGGTVYRDGSRDEQVLRATTKTASVFQLNGHATPSKNGVDKAGKRRLPADIDGPRHKFSVAGLECFLHIGLYEDGSVGEVFVRSSKMGSTLMGFVDSWAINFSIALQYGVPLEDLCKHHISTRFEPCGMTGNAHIPTCTSIPDYVCRWLLRKFVNKDKAVEEKGQGSASGMYCPDCGQEALYQAGCLVCSKQCGWSRCG